MLHIHTILHPTDFSDAAQQALQLAVSLARDHQAQLVIVGVTPPPAPVSEVYVPVGELAGLLEELRRQLHALATTIAVVPVKTVALQGPAGQMILSAAESEEADLIVMGTHGRGGLSRLVMGSVAEYVMRHAHCPVLTVKPGANQRMPVEVVESTDTPPASLA